jgi:selenocysteine lyase/cysteine desulfurase
MLDALPVAKVRPADDEGPRRWETGTPNLEGIVAIDAAAKYLLEEGVANIAADEARVCGALLEGLAGIDGVRVWGRPTMDGRVPTVGFTVDGVHPDDVAARLAAERIATWAGDSYAREVIDQFGLAARGGIVRAGVVAYITDDDVARLLAAVTGIAAR